MMKPTFRRLLLAIAALSLCVGTDAGAPQGADITTDGTETRYIIGGRVTNKDGDPISGAIIRYGPEETTSDPNGRYRLVL